MTEIEAILEELLHYYNTNRQVGHTRLMFEGVDNVANPMVITASAEQATMFASRKLHDHPGAMVVSLHDLSALRARQMPLALDNYAIWEIAKMARDLLGVREAKSRGIEADLKDERMKTHLLREQVGAREANLRIKKAELDDAATACKAAYHAIASVLATRDGPSDELLQDVLATLQTVITAHED